MTRSDANRLRIVLGALAVLVLGWSGTAAAEKKRVGVARFDGPQETVVRRAVMQALVNDGYEVIGGKELAATAQTAGVELDSNDGFKAVAKELAISSFVAGEVGKKKAKLTVRNGSDGTVSGEGSFAGANVAKIAADVRDNFSRRLGSAVERGRVPSGAKRPAAPAAETTAEEAPAAASAGDDSKPSASNDKPEKADTGDKADTSDKSGDATPAATDTSTADTTVAKSVPPPAADTAEVGPRALDLEVGIHGFTRSLSYNQDYYNTLRTYSILGPALALHVVAYPAGFVTGGIGAWFGAEANVDWAVGLASNIKPGMNTFMNGGTVGTEAHDYNVGLRARLILGGGSEIALFGGGGEHAFVFHSTASVDRSTLDIPDTIYRYGRGGLEGLFQVSPGFSIKAEGAYRYVFNQGGTNPNQIAYLATNATTADGYFPGAKVGGIDAAVTLAYQITPSIEARLGVDLRRYFFTMNSSKAAYPVGDYGPNGPVDKIAGGAVDQYIGVTVGAAYVFGGVSPSASPPAEEEPPKKKHKKKKKADDDAAGGAPSGGDASDSGGDNKSDE